LPPLTFDEALETTKIHSISGLLSPGSAIVATRPFRAPHHTISDAALVGGGVGYARPGEISLSHNGVLFLDELPEFARNVLEVLRQPLEEGTVTIARSKSQRRISGEFHAHRRDESLSLRQCRQSPARLPVQRDAGAEIHGPHFRTACSTASTYTSNVRRSNTRNLPANAVVTRPTSSVPASLPRASDSRRAFASRSGMHCNAMMNHRDIAQYCRIDDQCRELLRSASQSLGFSARAYDRILKVGRTIADLAGSDAIRPEHISEAIQYRDLDRRM
jgi:magnesium chelatase family protein